MVKKEALEKEKLVKSRVPEEPIEEEKVKKIARAEEVEETKDEGKVKEEEIKRERYLKREEREKLAKEEMLAQWKPKTKLGILVKSGQVKKLSEVFDKGYTISEAEIVDTLLPNLKNELVLIGQSKGKFGGGKRRFWRQTQKKTAEGNVPHFTCMAIVGDQNGHVGIGLGKAKETLPAKEKALRNAKLSLTPIRRGCGSFDCSCSEKHSIPFRIEGKRGSSVIRLMPAPKGTGLVVENECKKVLRLAGIKDAYSRTFGQSRTKINLAGACYNSLKKALEMKQ